MTKRSVALAITDLGRPGSILLVQRPADDDELPGLWGLPAATLAPHESWDDAARRAARHKLGIEVDVGPILAHGELHRPHYRLEMRLLHATIRHGSPSAPQPYPDVTQYQAVRWGPIPDLQHAAGRGSLCARLCLDWHADSRS